MTSRSLHVAGDQLMTFLGFKFQLRVTSLFVASTLLASFSDVSWTDAICPHELFDGKSEPVKCEERPAAAATTTTIAAQCLNGGQCYVIEPQTHINNSLSPLTCCRCNAEWMGDYCEHIHIGYIIATEHNENLYKSSLVAIIFVAILVFCVAVFALFVFIRYKRKSHLSADRLFRATADELYRRPFNGRSSIVESLSRINSIRRTNDKEKEEGCIDTDEQHHIATDDAKAGCHDNDTLQVPVMMS